MEQDRPAVRVLNGGGGARYVLICEHASNWMPDSYHGLGLPPQELKRHIAWDIGAAQMARCLSDELDAPLILAGASRLLVDLNRPLNSSGSMPEMSEATQIPGNMNLSQAERAARAERWFHPFQAAVNQLLDARQAQGQPTIVLGIHTFTPVFLGQVRPWKAGILYRKSAAFAGRLVDRLGGAAHDIAHNQPYQIDDESDYTVPVHGEARGLDAVLIEVRQDLVATPEGAEAWAARLAVALRHEGA